MKTKRLLIWTSSMVMAACLGALVVDYYHGAPAMLSDCQDARLKDMLKRAACDWKKTTDQVLSGVALLKRVDRPFVTIFGGHKVKEGDKEYQMAFKLSQELVKKGYGTISGGGPGIMAAVDCGANSIVEGAGVGITVKGFKPNACIKNNLLTMDYFFSRKWLMIQYAKAFVLFPGGIGSYDELTEILTLMSTKNMPVKPIIVVGKEFWKPFIEGMKGDALKRGIIHDYVFNLMVMTDDMAEVLKLIEEKKEQGMIPVPDDAIGG